MIDWLHFNIKGRTVSVILVSLREEIAAANTDLILIWQPFTAAHVC